MECIMSEHAPLCYLQKEHAEKGNMVQWMRHLGNTILETISKLDVNYSFERKYSFQYLKVLLLFLILKTKS